MKIGHYVAVVAGQRGFENNVSGHVQIPLHAMQLLADAGHEVHLITTAWGPERTLPVMVPRGVPVHTVIDSRHRGGVLERTAAPGGGVSLRQFMQQARQLRSIARRERFDVLHFYGFNRTAQLAGLLRLTGLGCPAVVTVFGVGPESLPAPMARFLWRRTSALVSATTHVQQALGAIRVPSRLVRHGIVRDLDRELEAPAGPRHRVLFWRDPSPDNGADIALAVAEALAPKYPDLCFTFAIRPWWDEVPGIEDAAEHHPNVEVHRFPYPPGISVAKLMAESLLVLQPFRKQSIDPQLVIAESLASGVAVVATDQRSNPELLVDGRHGALVPVGDAEATIRAVDRLLADRDALLAMGRCAREELPQTWTWARYVDEITAVYRDVVGDPVAPRTAAVS